jgi:hypothetical protein
MISNRVARGGGAKMNFHKSSRHRTGCSPTSYHSKDRHHSQEIRQPGYRNGGPNPPRPKPKPLSQLNISPKREYKLVILLVKLSQLSSDLLVNPEGAKIPLGY